MRSNAFSRRDFSMGLAVFSSGLGIAGTAFGHSVPRAAFFAGSEEVSQKGEAVHQEVIFKANRKRVYEALTDAKQFNKVVQLSAAGMSLGKIPTEISHEAGGAFSLFGGHIVGRHVELVPNERIVQAWRVVDWSPGIYSIVKFELTDQGSGAKLVCDHRGFPDGQGQHLAEGWKANYWDPLAKYLG
jgi:activator of HSP90 ATPase